MGTTVPTSGTYDAQLAARVDEHLPDLDTDARLELLGVMNPDDMRTSLAWLISYAPQVFDFAIVRDVAMTGRLLDRLVEDHDDEDGLEPYCSACGGQVGIFLGHGEDWHHFRGNGSVEAPNELYDAGHAPVVAWREAAAEPAPAELERTHMGVRLARCGRHMAMDANGRCDACEETAPPLTGQGDDSEPYRHADYDAGENGGAMTDADYYDRLAEGGEL